MFDDKKLKEIYVENSDALDESFDEYVKSAYGSAVNSILTDAFQNRVLKQTRNAFPDYYAKLRRSGDMDMEIAVFNIPIEECRIVREKVRDMIELLDPEREFYLGVHIVNIGVTKEHYPQYSELKNSAQQLPS